MGRPTAAAAREDSESELDFQDGLGTRLLATDPDTGETVERLVVNADLAGQERALRDRVERLLNFRNVRFPRLFNVHVETRNQQTHVSIVSDHVPGVRLSHLLPFVASHPTLVVDVNAALQVAREVLPALAVLHDSRGVTHGALALERLILTPQARVVIADFALGAALAKLSFPRTRLWREYRLAMPPSAGVAQFDNRADVAGLALAVLALMQGQPLTANDFPSGLRRLLDTAVERLPNGTVRPLSSSLRGWFDRALPTENRRPFGTAPEAQLALEEVLTRERAYAPSPSALKSFLQRYAAAKPDRMVDGRAALARAATPQLAVAPSPEPARRSPSTSTTSRAATRRLTPEEEEAEEIRALEAELARIAREEAEEERAHPTTSPEASAIEPVPAAVSDPETIDLLLDVFSADEPQVVSRTPASPTASSAEPIEPLTESVEIAILAPGPMLPRLDVASLADEVTSTVLGSAGDEPIAELLPSTMQFDDQAAHDLDPGLPADAIAIAPVGDATESPAVAEATEPVVVEPVVVEPVVVEPADVEPAVVEAVVVEPVVVEAVVVEPVVVDHGPIWALTSPAFDTQPIAVETEPAHEAVARCERTRSIDFDVPPVYVQDLVSRGAITPALECKPGILAREDLQRVQTFAACVASEPSDAVSPLRRTRRRRAREGTAHARALPERTATAVSGGLSVRRPRRLEALAAAAAAQPESVVVLTLVAALPRHHVVRPPVAALAQRATPVPCEMAVRHAGILESLTQTPGAVSLLPLVAPHPQLRQPVLALTEAPAVDAAVLELDAVITALEATAADDGAPESPLFDEALAVAVLDDQTQTVDDLFPSEVVVARDDEPAPADVTALFAVDDLAALEAELAQQVPAAPAAGSPASALVPIDDDAPSDAALDVEERSAAPEPPVVEESPADVPKKKRRAKGKSRRADPSPLAYEPWRVPAPSPLETSSVRPTRALPADPWNTGAEAAKETQVLPFVPRPVESTASGRMAASDELAAPATIAPFPVAETARLDGPAFTLFSSYGAADEDAAEPRRVGRAARRGWRIDWKRTAAASLAVMLLEGVAFAAAYWFVKPTEMGSLLVDASQAGIEVLIDGRESGTTPLSVQLKPGRYTLEMRGYGVTKVVPVEISPGVQTTQSLKWPRGARVGTLNVKTTPPGARISLDGDYRGTAPLVLADVPVGEHMVLAESPSGTVTSRIAVSEKAPADLDLAIFSGFLTVYAPVEVRVFDGNKLLGTSLDGKMLVSAGPHTLDLVNKRLGYREQRTVNIEPGKESVLSLQAPDGTIVIEAPDGTEILIDGQPAGTMPIDKVTAPIGTRDVVLKHPAIGQRRLTVTVGADIPVRVSLLAPQ